MILGRKATVLDVGTGNVDAVVRMVKRAGGSVSIASDQAGVLAAERLVIPGVGKFDTLMSALMELNLINPIRSIIDNGIPIFGICLGMQILFEHSEEGHLPGLGVIHGGVRRIRDEGQMIPHIGWNMVSYSEPLFADSEGRPDPSEFYFCHSFVAEPRDTATLVATVEHGYSLPAAIRSGPIHGVQFHPEKSHLNGLQVFESFLGYENA